MCNLQLRSEPKLKRQGLKILGGTRSIRILCWGAMALAAMALGSCTPKLLDKFDPEKYDKIDRDLDLSREDYRTMNHPKIPDLIDTVEIKPAPPPPLPSLSQILAAPRPPEIGETQLVSIAVTDDVPLKDVLLELARLADVDVELDAGISGGIAFTARDKPFNEVIARIADLAGLRYVVKGSTLRVERDLPYMESYSLDFLNIDRNSSSNISISTNVLSASGGGGGGGGGALNSGSSQTITANTQSDFWTALQSGILQILNYQPKKRWAKIDDPEAAAKAAAAAAAAAGGAGGDPAAAVAPGMEDCAILQQGGSRAAGGGVAALSGGDCQTFYTINRQAGILTVSATRKQHDSVRRYIEQIKTSASAQVLIEAKIVEITLDEQYESGIKWSAVTRSMGLDGNFNSVDTLNSKEVFTATLPTRTIAGVDMDEIIQLIQRFGTTRTLSSPRLHAINNQQAVLTFAKNYVYFDIKAQQQNTAANGVNNNLLTVDSTVKTVPIGIILTLQPSINTDTGEITLVVRPTLSRIAGEVDDPAVTFLSSQLSQQGSSGTGLPTISNKIPVVEVREMDSILKVKSGEVMVIGGLMQNSASNSDNGLPGVAEVPWIGNLFKAVEKKSATQELIIFIRATLVNSTGNSANADQALYTKFTRDPRPLDF